MVIIKSMPIIILLLHIDDAPLIILYCTGTHSDKRDRLAQENESISSLSCCAANTSKQGDYQSTNFMVDYDGHKLVLYTVLCDLILWFT